MVRGFTSGGGALDGFSWILNISADHINLYFGDGAGPSGPTWNCWEAPASLPSRSGELSVSRRVVGAAAPATSRAGATGVVRNLWLRKLVDNASAPGFTGVHGRPPRGDDALLCWVAARAACAPIPVHGGPFSGPP